MWWYLSAKQSKNNSIQKFFRRANWHKVIWIKTAGLYIYIYIYIIYIYIIYIYYIYIKQQLSLEKKLEHDVCNHCNNSLVRLSEQKYISLSRVIFPPFNKFETIVNRHMTLTLFYINFSRPTWKTQSNIFPRKTKMDSKPLDLDSSSSQELDTSRTISSNWGISIKTTNIMIYICYITY